MPSLVRRLAVVGGLAVLFFFAYITAIRLAYMLVYFAVLLLAVCWAWTRLAARGLTVTRDGHEGAYEVGQEFRERIEVHNSALVGAPLVVVEDRSRIPGYDASRVFSLAGRGARRWTTSGRFTTRGRYPLGPVRVTAGDPFGFFQRSRTIPVQASITIYPRLVDVARYLPGSLQSSGEARVFGRYLDTPPDALGIREHNPADGYNRIHWPSTARLGRPMSRSFERYEGSDTTIILDLGAGVHHGRGASSTLEYSVTLAASLAVAANAQGQSISLRCNDAAATVIPAGSSPVHLRRVLDFLAVAQADGTRAIDVALPPGSAGGLARQSLVVISPAAPGRWVDVLAGGRDGGRRTTVLHVGDTDVARERRVGEMTWWELAPGALEPPVRLAS